MTLPPTLAAAMLTRALDAGVPAGWVTADEVYGADPNYVLTSKPAKWDTCWPSAVTGACSPPPGHDVPTRSPRACPNEPGSGSQPDQAPRDSATTTGR